MTQTPNLHLPKPYGMLIVLWLVGWTLRITVLSVPPLAIHIADDFGLGESLGALTMLPVVAIALGALPAAWFINRFGLRISIVGGLLVMVAASIARGQVPSTLLLFFMSALMGLGIAVFQTALPAATRCWTPSHLALGSAVYLNGMMMGELTSAGLTLPVVLPMANGDWTMVLILWAIPILLITLLVVMMKTPPGAIDNVAIEAADSATFPNWKDKRLWQFSILYTNSIIAFFIINAYCGSILRQRGEIEALEEFLFGYNAMPLLGSLLILAKPKWVGYRNPIGMAALCALLGLAGFTFFTGWLSWIAACITGFSATVMLILLLSLPPYIATGKAVTRLSAGMTLLGFSLSFALSLVGGWLADISQVNHMALIPALVFMLLSMAALGRHKLYPKYS